MLSSCSKNADAPTATESAGQILALDEASGYNALEKKFADYGRDVKLDKDGRVAKDSKRSSFESQRSSPIGGNLARKEYAATRYSKKNWQGTKNFTAENYASKKNRWQNEEYFIQKQARETGATSRVQGQSYATGDYRTGSARESGGDRLARPNDLKTEIRQRDAPKPLIMDNEDYEKMSLNESKRLLGRE